MDAARQYMNLWAIERDAAMDGEDVSCLVAGAFLEHANLDIGIADYRHLVAYFGGAIKQSYCTKFPIDETSGHSSATAARHYANCSNDHRFMDSQQMYTYKLAAEAWHRLLQLNGSPVDPPPSRTSTVEIPTIIDQPNSHCPLQFDCASLLASLMYSTTQVTTPPAISPPPQDPTHEVRSLRALCRLGHDQWTCKEQGLAVTLVLENRLDLLVVMPTGHGKSAVFMIPPMVTARTVIVVVPLTILVNGHEADASQAGLRNATYGTDTITLDDPPSILFVSVECAATPRFVELGHTLNHLQKLHCVVVDEAHLLLSDFRPVMKRLLPLWAVECQLVALTASLSPYQETDLKIVMSTTFIVIRMSTVRPLIEYVVDEVVDVDDEIVRQLIEWDCDVSSETDRAMVYCLTRQSVERMASVVNNVAGVRTTHLHAHLDEDSKKAQLQSWLSGEARVMVATGVIGCGYNYPSVRLVIHRRSFRSLVALHQESGRLARDGRPGISRVISSAKSRVEALHIDSSFVEPNAWIMDMENCRRHNLHLAVDGQSQRCSLIPAARPCDNCVWQSRATSLQPPPAFADAQGTGDCAHLFHERGSYIFDEFSSICYS
jgi:superfamily II DNA or RNA helicase